MRATELEEWTYGTVSESTVGDDVRESGMAEVFLADNTRCEVEYALDGVIAVMPHGFGESSESSPPAASCSSLRIRRSELLLSQRAARVTKLSSSAPFL